MLPPSLWYVETQFIFTFSMLFFRNIWHAFTLIVLVVFMFTNKPQSHTHYCSLFLNHFAPYPVSNNVDYDCEKKSNSGGDD